MYIHIYPPPFLICMYIYFVFLFLRRIFVRIHITSRKAGSVRIHTTYSKVGAQRTAEHHSCVPCHGLRYHTVTMYLFCDNVLVLFVCFALKSQSTERKCIGQKESVPARYYLRGIAMHEVLQCQTLSVKRQTF